MKQVIELSQVEGDQNRMKKLSRDFGVSLVGKKGLCSTAESLIANIKLCRPELNEAENGPVHVKESS
jgi:lysine-specific histone demethylase 1